MAGLTSCGILANPFVTAADRHSRGWIELRLSALGQDSIKPQATIVAGLSPSRTARFRRFDGDSLGQYIDSVQELDLNKSIQHIKALHPLARIDHRATGFDEEARVCPKTTGQSRSKKYGTHKTRFQGPKSIARRIKQFPSEMAARRGRRSPICGGTSSAHRSMLSLRRQTRTKQKAAWAVIYVRD